MKKSITIFFSVGVVLLFFVGLSVYKFFGYKYWKPTLFFQSIYVNEATTDTEFSDIAAANISLLKNVYKEEFYIIKKYRYSKDVWTVGYGGDGGYTNNYFYYGLADSAKNVLIPALYEYLHVFEEPKTGKLFVLCQQSNGTKAYYDVVETESEPHFLKRKD